MRLIKSALAGLLAMVAATAAVAQTFPVVPDHTVIGRIGQVGQSGPSQAIPFATLQSQAFGFTQTGVGAVSISLNSIFQDKIFTPEMFTTVPISAAYNTAVASVPNASTAIQAAITQLCLVGGGTLQLGPRAYGVTASVNIPCNNVYIRGSGVNATQIVHKMIGPSTAFFFSAGAGLLSNTGISDLSIQSADTTNTKVAVTLSDVSQFAMRNINIAHYPVDGSLYRGTGGSGTGIQIRGRELGTVENVQISADKPINIQINPNSAVISMDSWVFRDLTLVAALSGSPTTSVITVDTAVAMFNTKFEGHQNWIGGLDGFHWVDTTSAVASLGLTLAGIKAEQSPIAATGYTVNIQKNAALLGLKIVDGIAGDRNGIRLRNVTTASIDNFFFGPPGASVGLNIDSTIALTEISNSYWLSPATATITGQNISQRSNFVSGASTALPSSGRYTSTTPSEQFSAIGILGGTSGIASIAAQSAAGTPTLTLPNASGTLASNATAPIVLNATTGNISLAGTLPAFTLGGTVAGGGNQINNVIIGTTTPLAGFFTALSATTTVTAGGAGTGSPTDTFIVNSGVVNKGIGIYEGTGAIRAFLRWNTGSGGYIGVFDASSGGSTQILGTGDSYIAAPAAGASLGVNTQVTPGSAAQSGNSKFLTMNGLIQHAKNTVANLPACAAALEGSRYGVTDSNTTTFNATVAGGGANHVAVYCNGTNWVLQ